MRPFRWWFLGQVMSASGLMTQMVAVGWLVLHWGGSGVELGLLSTAGSGPRSYSGYGPARWSTTTSGVDAAHLDAEPARVTQPACCTR